MAGWWLVCALAWSAVVLAGEPMNVLFIVVDDLGWNDVGFHGSDIPTPTIDSFANTGIKLTNYYIQPLCSPSRTALMTGRYPYHLGTAHFVILNGFNQSIPANETTLPQKMKEYGYSTHMLGKWDCGMTTWEDTPTYRGFDTFYGYYNGFETYYTKTAFAYAVPPQYENITGYDFRDNVTPSNSSYGVYSTLAYTERAVEIIETHNTTAPLFIYMAYQAIHSPLEYPPNQYPQCKGITNQNRNTICAMMQEVDMSIKNITDALNAKNLLKNTLIIFTSDNGAQVPEGGNNWPYRGNKDTVFEGGIKGSAFVWGSMVPSGETVDALMHITDWLPTIVGAIGGTANTTNPLDGVNQWSALTSGAASARDEFLVQLDPPNAATTYIGQAALRYQNWKLIVGLPNCSIPEFKTAACPTGWTPLPPSQYIPPPPDPSNLIFLYDLDLDPYEKNNIAEAHPDIVKILQQKLQIYRNENIVQQPMIFDPTSNPINFGGFWTPWQKSG